MITRILLLFFSFLCLQPLAAQEALRPLNGRINCVQQEQRPRKTETHAQNGRTQATSRQLPFLDDFYYASTNLYPDPDLWTDSLVYINTGFPIAPPSVGVATFDGLNKHGYPYTPQLTNLGLSSPADTLTSQPINLHLYTANSHTIQLSDSIALSFFYQAQGNGEAPETYDSLSLDFYSPTKNRWYQVWGTGGITNANASNNSFKKVFVWITDTIGDSIFLHDNFRFRFRNNATTAGDFDHWHVDYVYMNMNRTITESRFYNDLTLGGIPTSFLKNYSAMPYKQYIPAEKADTIHVKIQNDGNVPANMYYENRMYRLPDETQVSFYTGGSNILNVFDSIGYSTYPNHAAPPFNYTFPLMSNMIDYRIKHYVYRSDVNSSDFIRANDTVIQLQSFRNYYALDDGSAESGYYVYGQGGQMAIKVTLNQADTLEGLYIYFDPVGIGYSDTILQRFEMNIWSAGDNGPGSLLFSDAYVRNAQYYQQYFRVVPEYKFVTPKALAPGTYYIGIQQKISTGITVGFDKNYDHHQSFYYNSGGGWLQSGFAGSPMIRPIFGALLPTGISENRADKSRAFSVYPNPSSGEFIISSGSVTGASYQLMNMLGQSLMSDSITQPSQTITTGSLSSGVYLLVIKDADNRLLQQQKLILQR